MKFTAFFLLLGIGFTSWSQLVNYNDVVVIVNDNSQTSIDIGNYFQQARSIPNSNMIHILAPTTEEIDTAQYSAIRTQIENQLLANDYFDSLNYIVTTKGVPLKISGACLNTNPQGTACSSFDAELCSILGPYATNGVALSYQNPFLGSSQHFSRAGWDIFLVTRLDAYTKQDVYNLIDRSGPGTPINQITAQAIVDMNYASGGDSTYLSDNYLMPTYNFLTANNWNAQLHPNFDPLLNQTNVFAYISGGFVPPAPINMNYTWTEGSISSISHCYSAATFDMANNPNNDFQLANLLAEGCTGGLGNANCIFAGEIPNSETIMMRYLDPIGNYNLAESFYMGIMRLGWQSVVIGDPKSSMKISTTASTPTIDLETLSVFPNPSSGSVQISGSANISSVRVIDMMGSIVQTRDDVSTNSIELDLSELRDGVYMIQAVIGGILVRERLVVKK